MGIQINGNTDTISALDGSWTSDSATHFTGKVSIGGTLTYEDVTNIDSVGIVTARDGVFIPDNKELKIGNTAGTPDLKIYHSSSNNNTYIEESGSGYLIAKSNRFEVTNAAGTEALINAVQDSGVKLYDGTNTARLETTSSGATVTGKLTSTTAGIGTATPATTLDVQGDMAVAYNATHALRFYTQPKNNWSSISNTATDGNANLSIKTSQGEAIRITYSKLVGIGTDNPDRKLHVGGSFIRVDDGYGLDSSGSTEKVILDNGFIQLTTNSKQRFRIDSSGNVHLGDWDSQGTTYGKARLNIRGADEIATSFSLAGSYLHLGGQESTLNGLYPISFGHTKSSYTKASSYIAAKVTDASSAEKTALVFATRDAVTDSDPEERVRITESGALLVGLTAPTYSSGDIQHEIKKNNSRTYTAPLMAAHSHLLLNNSDTTNGVFCGIGIRAGTGDGAIGFNYRGATNHSDFVVMTDSGANGVEGFRIKSQTRTCSIGEITDPLNALHILDKTTSEWESTLNANRAALRVETHYNAQGERAVGDYGSGIVFNHLGGHSSTHNNDSHAWLGLRVHDTPGMERSCLVFATNDITTSESGHDAGLKERMQINPHGQVAINYTGTMVSNSHARLWVESVGNNLATEWDPGDNQGTLPHLTLAGQNNHVRLDMGTMDTAPFAGYIQARYDNSPDLGASDTNDGLEPLMIQPRGGQTYFNFGHSTTMPANFDPDSEEGGIKIRAGTADSASVSEANTAIKIWPAKAREYSGGRMGDADEGSKHGGISWLVMDGQSNSGWAAYDGNLCWMGMSIHSTPGQELGNWQLRMNSSGNQNSVANNIALQASPQGWVTKPNAIVFMAHHNAGTRITSTGYQTFGDQIEDNGGDHYSNSNGKFTAPIGGYYYLYLKVNAVNRIDMQIRINGSTDHTHREIGQFNTSNAAGGWFSHNITRIFRMEKDEYAQVYISSLNQQTDPGEWCTFGGFLIG